MSLRDLIRKRIVDKNGKQTTVLVKPPTAPATRDLTLISSGSLRISVPNVPIQAQANKNSDGEWDGEKLEHIHMFHNEHPSWVLAPEGYSGGYCYRCGSFFTSDEASANDPVCSVCSAVNRGNRLSSGVRASDVQLFKESATRDTDWYHITTKSDWAGDITKDSLDKQPYVHVGSLDAAQRRMQDIKKENINAFNMKKNVKNPEEVKFYLYKVKMKPDAPLASTVIMDYDQDAPISPAAVKEAIEDDLMEDGGHYNDQEEFFSMYEMYGATRYVNEYESHGSISLIAHASSLEILERIELD